MKGTIYGNRLPRGTQVKKGREPLGQLMMMTIMIKANDAKLLFFIQLVYNPCFTGRYTMGYLQQFFFFLLLCYQQYIRFVFQGQLLPLKWSLFDCSCSMWQMFLISLETSTVFMWYCIIWGEGEFSKHRWSFFGEQAAVCHEMPGRLFSLFGAATQWCGRLFPFTSHETVTSTVKMLPRVHTTPIRMQATVERMQGTVHSRTRHQVGGQL